MNDLMTLKMRCLMGGDCDSCDIQNECRRMFGDMTPNLWQDDDIGSILVKASKKISFRELKKMIEGLHEESSRRGDTMRAKNESASFFNGEENAYEKILNLLKECDCD